MALIQAMLLALFVFLTSPKNVASWLVACLLITVLISLGHDVLLHSRLIMWFPQILGFGPFHTYLIGPLIFLVALKLAHPERVLSKWHILHFVPFLLHALSRIPNIFKSSDSKLSFLKNYYQSVKPIEDNLTISFDYIYGLFSFYGHRFIYIAIAILLLLRAKSSFEYSVKPRKHSYKAILSILLGYSVGWLTLKIMHFIPGIGGDLRNYTTMINSIALSGLTLFVALGLFKYRLKEIFSTHNSRKYEKSGLDESTSSLLLEEIDKVMKDKQLFTLPELKQSDLAKEMSLTNQQISQAINQTQNESFNDYINRYRIEYFKQLVVNQARGKLNISQLAIESGFSSKATFYRVFKERVGMTPTQYISSQ